jgi:glycerol uptake facilitator-like aquaporin
MARFSLPDDPVLASKLVDHEARRGERQLEGGFMGRIFGFSTEKPGNIAAFSLIVSFVLLACILALGTDTSSVSKKDEITIVVSIITLALGFVFGRSTT